MEVYKKIASVKTLEELHQTQAEIIDRFGPAPPEAASLLAIAEIRAICRALGVSRLKEKGGLTRITFSSIKDINIQALLHMIQTSGGLARANPAAPGELILSTGNVGLAEKAFFIREKLEALHS